MSTTAKQTKNISPGIVAGENHGPDSTEDIWKHFLAEVQEVQHDKDALSSAVQLLLPQAHQNLLHLPAYQKLVDEAHKAETTNGLWVANDIYQDKHIHVALLTVFRGQPLPFHDHPDVSGMLLIISGETRAIHCNVTASDEDAQTAELAVILDRTLGTGQVGSFSANNGNIHGLEPQSDKCVILVAHTPPYNHKLQSFYFPMSVDIRENNSFSAMKLSAGKFKELASSDS